MLDAYSGTAITKTKDDQGITLIKKIMLYLTGVNEAPPPNGDPGPGPIGIPEPLKDNRLYLFRWERL